MDGSGSGNGYGGVWRLRLLNDEGIAARGWGIKSKEFIGRRERGVGYGFGRGFCRDETPVHIGQGTGFHRFTAVTTSAGDK